MMNEDRPFFILAGNGSFENRGCEAIVRGTVKILREYFRDPRFVCLSHFQSEEQYKRQSIQEKDGAIVHLTSHYLRSKKEAIKSFWKLETLLYMYRHLFDPAALKYQVYRDMLQHLNNATAVLSIGGDNYSLDYGVPTPYTSLDDIVLEKGRPLAIWGASIGPFDRMPKYEEYMSRHLHEVTGIFSRESETINYLKGIGVAENVYHVADPAFLMDPEKPEEMENYLSIDEEAIGFNLSPLIAKYVTHSDLEAWASMAASIIWDLAQKTEMPIYLIPHVTNPIQNDYKFMQRVFSLIQNKNGTITLVPPIYNAAETKWIISQMAIFAGARTHSTIAALSTDVPTLSFAYSMKARGINRDIFGHLNYCINPEELSVRTVSDRIRLMLEKNANIKRDLKERIPAVQRSALYAGSELRRLIEE